MSLAFARTPAVGPRGPGTTQGYMTLLPELGEPSTTNFPQATLKAGTNIPLSLLGFSHTTTQSIYFKLFPATYGPSNQSLTIKIEWESDTGQTTGAAVFGAALVAVVPGSTANVETMALAAQVTATKTVNATAHGLTETIITVSGASLGVLAAGAVMWLQIQRVTGGADTMTGNANMLWATVIWSLT